MDHVRGLQYDATHVTAEAGDDQFRNNLHHLSRVSRRINQLGVLASSQDAILASSTLGSR